MTLADQTRVNKPENDALRHQRWATRRQLAIAALKSSVSGWSRFKHVIAGKLVRLDNTSGLTVDRIVTLKGGEVFAASSTTKPSLASRRMLDPVVLPSCSPEVDTRTLPVHSFDPTETLAGSDPRLRTIRIRSGPQTLKYRSKSPSETMGWYDPRRSAWD